MKNLLFLFLVIATLQVSGQGKSYDYAYLNKNGICVYSLIDKKEYPVVATLGDTPSLSPDGKRLAYTATNKKGDRFIAVIDLNTKKKTILNTNSNNCYGPAWSPNGKFIAYNVFNAQKSQWFITVIDPDNGAAKVVTGSLNESYMPSWTFDSKSIVVQDLQKIYVVNLSGNITGTYKIADMTNLENSGPTSADRFALTKDNKKIVFSTETDEPGDKDGPPTAIFVYDIASKTALRLSPKGYFADDIVVKGNQVLFTGSKVKSTVQNVYAVDMDGRNLKILFAGCSEVTAKNN